MNTNKNTKNGFTLIEMLVVIGIISILSGIFIVYSRTGEQQIVLFKEQAKVMAAVSRAKILGISAFRESSTEAGSSCGYGVHIELPNTVIIFKDIAQNCELSDQRYTPANPSEKFESFQLDPRVKLDVMTSLTDIVFIPPDPSVVITPDQDQAVIVIKTIDDKSSATIKVNSAGQIST
jgi:prepilin-type N-terminal cleavage/methylation domain-containing protein